VLFSWFSETTGIKTSVPDPRVFLHKRGLSPNRSSGTPTPAFLLFRGTKASLNNFYETTILNFGDPVCGFSRIDPAGARAK
jgi:hypothetical protein